jgi:hypothetical protein
VVGDGSYRALVPTSAQFTEPEADGIPGGFIPLRDAGVDAIEVIISGDDVTMLLDGREAVSRRVEERLVVRDSEGSGPFKAEKEVLVLGEEPLVVGGLTIDRPVVWPGSFEGSPIITVKPRDPDERGPVVSCGADDGCPLLSSGVDPVGRYEDANNPELDENPIAWITVSETAVEFMLDSNERIRMSRESETFTRSCGLSETFVWDVPTGVGLEMDDPVLVQAACPTTPGDVMLHIFERTDMPVLAPLGPKFGGEWCPPSADCLMFVPAP